jgi:hypothetical protein
MAACFVTCVLSFLGLRSVNVTLDLPWLDRYFLYVWGLPVVVFSWWLKQYVRPARISGLETQPRQSARSLKFRSHKQMQRAWLLVTVAAFIVLSLVAESGLSAFISHYVIWLAMLTAGCGYIVLLAFVDRY